MAPNLSLLIPAPISPLSPTFFTQWSALCALMLILSYLAQREGTGMVRLAFGVVGMGLVWRVGGGGLGLEGPNTFWNFPYALAVLPTAAILPRLSFLPSSSHFTHLRPQLVPSLTLDLLASPTLLNWSPAPPAQPRPGPAKSVSGHVWAWARALGVMGGVWVVCLGLYPVWDAYEEGRQELVTEVGVGAVAATMAYCIVESAFHAGSAILTLAGWSGECFPEIMHRPWKSDSIHSFWSHRWHALLSPIFLLFSSPISYLPLPKPITSALQVPLVFLLSGLYHEFGLFPIFRALRPDHPELREHNLWNPSTHIFTRFFAAQAVPFLLERAWKQTTGKRVGGWVGWAWCWVWLFGTGRWVSRACRDSGLENVVAGWVREAWAELLAGSGESGWVGAVDGVLQTAQEGTRVAMKVVGW